MKNPSELCLDDCLFLWALPPTMKAAVCRRLISQQALPGPQTCPASAWTSRYLEQPASCVCAWHCPEGLVHLANQHGHPWRRLWPEFPQLDVFENTCHLSYEYQHTSLFVLKSIRTDLLFRGNMSWSLYFTTKIQSIVCAWHCPEAFCILQINTATLGGDYGWNCLSSTIPTTHMSSCMHNIAKLMFVVILERTLKLITFTIVRIVPPKRQLHAVQLKCHFSCE